VPWQAAIARVDLPLPESDLPIAVSAAQASKWKLGAYDVYALEGDCQVRQGSSFAQANSAVVWVLQERVEEAQRTRIIAYFEGDVQATLVEGERSAQVRAQTWLYEFETLSTCRLKLPRCLEVAQPPPIYERAVARRDPERAGLQETQSMAPPAISPLPAPPPEQRPPKIDLPAPVLQGGGRRLLASPRSAVPYQIQWFASQDQTEWIGLIDGGVNLVVQGAGSLGVLDISADRAVVWTQSTGEPNLGGGVVQASQQPLEIYLEGNIVFLEGDRRIHADRMYYNVRNENGVVLDADLRTNAPGYQGMLRMKSDLVQITGRDRFLAQNTFVTSSMIGAPRYRLQSNQMEFVDQQFPAIDPATGMAAIDPGTGAPLVEHRQFLTSRNNFVYLGPVPVFYWPVFAADVTDASFFLRRVQLRNDRVLGTQILTTLNAYELLGLRNRPVGTQWDLHLDYLTLRGLGHGTTFLYNRNDLFGLGGPASGLFDAWGINDRGIDNLGLDRRDVPPEIDYRYRVLHRHRQLLPNNFIVSAEAGLVSDRNFLEAYYEREWDEFKDQTTNLELRRLVDGTSWYIRGQARPMEFFTETQWLPRFDHYWLGQSLFGDSLTWYEHTSLSYANYQIAAFPDNPVDAAKFVWFPWERIQTQGERLVTRQMIDAPLNLGPVKVVPFAMGEAGRWGEGLEGDALNRLYGQAGVRASIPFWSVNPAAESSLFNVHGLAHKVTLEAEYGFSAANQDLNDFPLYDPIDDNNIEQFRRRFTFNTFGGPLPNGNVPAQFDPRFYALRSGLHDRVTSPSYEIADDFQALRLNLLQRLQTKRGLPGQRRIIDWMVFNTGVVYFPNDNRDNFGKPFGLLNYDWRWYLGDRTAVVSDGVFDFFDEGQQIFTVGAYLNRPPRGTLYVGFRWLQGPDLTGVLTPFDSQVLIASYTYQLSPKWTTTLGTAVDIGGNGNIGQNIAITRIGESFLASVGFTADASKDNFGATFLIEPRFLPGGRLRGVAPPPSTLELQ
jgi:lipopolysaccharide export system protein LptA